jgi:hypothetical protein
MMRLLVLLVFLLYPATGQTVDEILADLTQISGLGRKQPIRQATMKREELRQFFEKRLKEVIKPEELRVEELAVKMLGLVPREFDLRKAVVDLMSEQAAAFYDYREGRMVLLDGSGDGMQRLALAHELAHALADQHFNLERYLEKAGDSDDAALARQSVMEGQAQWIMSEYMVRQTNQSLLKSRTLANMLMRSSSPGGQFPVFEGAPLYLRESLMFPYSEGMKFQHEVLVKLGRNGFREVFKHPPGTSREIMHPEEYLEKRKRRPAPKLPPGPGSGWKEIAAGTAGEFDHLILLRLYSPEQAGLAASWRSGVYRLYEQKASGQNALVYGSSWAGSGEAADFFEAYRRVLEGKCREISFAVADGTRMDGRCNGVGFETRLAADTVISREGLPDDTLKQ